VSFPGREITGRDAGVVALRQLRSKALQILGLSAAASYKLQEGMAARRGVTLAR